MIKNLNIRQAKGEDSEFIFSLSPRLADVAQLSWHSETMMQKMQDAYITQVLNSTDQPQMTFIAEIDNEAVGFIHACSHHDSISNELCATIPLLAVSKSANRCGVGSALMTAAEKWARAQDYRLLHLEVFANNDKAQSFYQRIGFNKETLHMVKTL
jgi:ribosomal protein S18 acetylase RimI-like enzyme